MTVAKLSSNRPLPPEPSPTRLPAQAGSAGGPQDVYQRPAPLPEASTPPKRAWGEELNGAWYMIKLVALTAVSGVVASVGDGWDWLRSKLSREAAN